MSKSREIVLSHLFGPMLKKYREIKGLSQPELANRVGEQGMDSSYISRIEAGKRNPESAITVELMKAVEVPPGAQIEFLLHAAYPIEIVNFALESYQGPVIVDFLAGVENNQPRQLHLPS